MLKNSTPPPSKPPLQPKPRRRSQSSRTKRLLLRLTNSSSSWKKRTPLTAPSRLSRAASVLQCSQHGWKQTRPTLVTPSAPSRSSGPKWKTPPPKSVDFSFTEGYKSKVDDESQAKLAEIMGEEFFMANFRQKVTLGVDMDLVPDKAAPAVVMMALTVEEAQLVAVAMAAMKKNSQAVAVQAKAEQAVANFDAEATLGQAVINGINHVASALALPDSVVTVKELVLPIKGFNKVRATEFTIEQNIAIDEVIKTPDSMKKGA